MVVPAEDKTGNVAPTNNLELGELLAVIKQMKQDLKQQMAEQNLNMAEHTAEAEFYRTKTGIGKSDNKARRT